MSLSPITGSGSPAGGGSVSFEKIADNRALSERQKIAEASRQFEAVLLRQILGEARKPVFESKLTSKSAVNAIYDDMVTAQLADSISQSGEFGLARTLAVQLTPKSLANEPDGAAAGQATKAPGASRRPDGAGVSTPTPVASAAVAGWQSPAGPRE